MKKDPNDIKAARMGRRELFRKNIPLIPAALLALSGTAMGAMLEEPDLNLSPREREELERRAAQKTTEEFEQRGVARSTTSDIIAGYARNVQNERENWRRVVESRADGAKAKGAAIGSIAGATLGKAAMASARYAERLDDKNDRENPHGRRR